MPQFLKQERVKKSTISLHVFHTCKNSLHVILFWRHRHDGGFYVKLCGFSDGC